MKKKSFVTLARLFFAIVVVMAQFSFPVLPVNAEEQVQASRFHSAGESTSGSTYFVDGEKGNDQADGHSPKTAWKSLEKVNETTFQPGDHILLNAQSTWNNQRLYPKGSGVSGKSIVVDIYDTDAQGKAVYETNRRPVINGGGTYSTGTFKRSISGGVQLVNQEYWEISNLEVTNSPELSDSEAYKKPGDAQRAGILILGYEQKRVFNSIKVRNNYVHDVQSEYYLNFSGSADTRRSKCVGGIIVLGNWSDENGTIVLPEGDHRSTTGFNDVLIENNVVQRVGLEGIRTKADADTSRGNSFYKTFSNIVIRNNYLEDIAGDGIVLSEVARGGLVEGNVAVRACNADYGTQNYAGVWAMSVDDGLFQYNEVYGIQYGYNDAEAYDIDMQSNRVTYQYNYSHHNTGGFLLLMSDQRDSVVRYNISANDGAGNRGTGADNPGGAGGYTFQTQSIFHYWVKNDGASMPLIHNNTIYVGDGISTSLFGEGNSSDNSGTIANFHNNILYKEGSGSLKFLTNYAPNGSNPVERKMSNTPEKYFKNNVIWPKDIASETSGATVEKLASGNNIFADPKLAISGNQELATQLAQQEFTQLADGNVADFTSKERLRKRANLFTLQADSPALGKALSENNAATEDFFGTSLANKILDIGAQQASNVEKLTKYEDVSLEISAITGVYPKLPDRLKVNYQELADGEVVAEGTKEFAVQWETISQKAVGKAGTVEVKGQAEGLNDSQISIKAKVTFSGELGEGKTTAVYPADQTAFVQKSDGNKAYSATPGTVGAIGSGDEYKYPYGVNYGDNYILKLKNSTSAGYNRRIFVEIDTTDLALTNDLKRANLQLSVMRYDAWSSAGDSKEKQLKNTQFQMDVYAVASDWQSNKVTWYNGPGNAEVPNETFIARNSFTNSEIIANGNVVNVDISSYIRKVMASGEVPQKISFLLAISDSKLPGYNADNAGFDAFSKEGAQKAYEDYQAGKLKLPENHSVLEKDTLAPKIILSNVYETGYEAIEITTAAGVAPELPKNVEVKYSDGTSKTVAVTWPELPESLYQKEGSFEVRGQAAGVSMPITANVKVTTEKIATFRELPELNRLMGTSRGELDLPTEVTAVLESGEETILKVTSWDDDVSNYSPSSPPGEYSFPAGLEEKVGVSNPQDLKVFQKVITHPIPEKIIFKEQDISIEAGTDYQIPVAVKGQGSYEQLDEWSSQLDFSLTGATARRSILPSVDATGKISVPEGTEPGNYEVLVTSHVLPTVREVFNFKVNAPVVVDKSALESAVAAADKLQAADYTPESWATFVVALSQGKAVLADASAIQTSVDQALADLNEAQSGLQLKQLVADRQALLVAMTEAQLKKADSYTPISWDGLTAALATAKNVWENEQADEQMITDAVVNLQQSIADLVFASEATSDKKQLAEAVATGEALEASDYTPASWSNLTTAMTQAEAVLSKADADQSEIDHALAEVQVASDQLIPIADLTALLATIGVAQSKVAADYTPESWSAFREVLEQAILISETDGVTQVLVDQASQKLLAAMDNLAAIIDRTALDATITKASSLQESTYTPSSWADFLAVMDKALALQKDPQADQESVDQITTALQAEIDQLVVKADKTALQAVVEKAQKKLAADYTTASWKVFGEKLAQGIDVLADVEATQEKVAQSVEELQTAMDKLVASVDKRALQAAVAKAQTKEAGDYTPSSWAILSESLAQAKLYLNLPTASQEAVDQATAELSAAINALEKETFQEVDKGRLEKLLAEAKDKKESDYTSASWKKLQEVQQTAQSVYQNEQVVQGEIDQAAADLEKGISQLVLKPTSEPQQEPEKGKESGNSTGINAGKIKVESSNLSNSSKSKIFPKTGEQTSYALVLIGVLLLSVVGIWIVRRNAHAENK